jgi:site-specific recombinase XerD
MKKHVRVVYDRKKVSAKTGTGKIELSIYLQEGERKWITVGKASPSEWMAIAESTSIQAKVTHYEEVIKAMVLLQEDMTIDNFNRHAELDELNINQGKIMYKGTDLRQPFVDYCLDHVEKEGLAKNSIKDTKVAFNLVKESGYLKTFADLTKSNIIAFDKWLRKDNNRSDYTIHGYHKKVKKYTKLLFQLEMIAEDPYQYVKFPKGSNKERNPLDESELLKMRKLKCTGHLDRARDLFIFMAYTGLAFCDMELFDFETMTVDRTDYTYIDGERLKTGSNFFTPILPPAMDVLKKYNYKLPLISNQKLNEYCHVIEALCQINKPVTCHIGRHSFATLMINYGFPLESVKKMLGHKDIKTTQIYAKISTKKVEDDVKKKLKKLK